MSAVLVRSQYRLTRLTSLRLQIYRGLGIEPILDDDGNLDRVLVGEWSLYFAPTIYRPLRCIESTSHDIHVVKFNNGVPDEDLVEEIWRLSLL